MTIKGDSIIDIAPKNLKKVGNLTTGADNKKATPLRQLNTDPIYNPTSVLKNSAIEVAKEVYTNTAKQQRIPITAYPRMTIAIALASIYPPPA